MCGFALVAPYEDRVLIFEDVESLVFKPAAVAAVEELVAFAKFNLWNERYYS